MITSRQLHIGRLSLGLSVNALAKLAGVAPNTLWGVEEGYDYKVSTMQALESTLRDRGVLFPDQTRVAVKMEWPDEMRPDTRETRDKVLAILNAGRKAKGHAPLIDGVNREKAFSGSIPSVSGSGQSFSTSHARRIARWMG